MRAKVATRCFQEKEKIMSQQLRMTIRMALWAAGVGVWLGAAGVPAVGQVDLEPMQMRVDSRNDPPAAEVRVRNNGAGTVAAGVVVRITAGANTFDGATAGALGQNATEVVRITLSAGFSFDDASGVRRVISAAVDPNNLVAETNENNNTNFTYRVRSGLNPWVARQHRVLVVNIHEGGYDACGSKLSVAVTNAGGLSTYQNLSVQNQVRDLIDNNTYDQIWIYDLSGGTDSYSNDYTAIANWFNVDRQRGIVCDGRIIAGLWNSSNVCATPWTWYASEGQYTYDNYYENLRIQGGGLMLGTDHDSFQAGINSINAGIGIGGFNGNPGTVLAIMDPNDTNPVLRVPNDIRFPHTCNSTTVRALNANSTPGNCPAGYQGSGSNPLNRTLFTLSSHNTTQCAAGATTPAMSSTIAGSLGFSVAITGCRVAAPGASNELTVTIVGQPSGNVTYQWTIDGSNNGGTAATYNTSGLSSGSHSVAVVVTDATGYAPGDLVTVSIGGPDCNDNCIPDAEDIDVGISDDLNQNGVPDECDVAITNQPDGLVVCFGASASFTVTATGTDLHYEWQKFTTPPADWTVVPGAPDDASFTISPVQLANAGQYRCRVYNDFGSALSAVATLAIETTPPTITCPANVAMNSDAGVCYATVNLGTATTGDNCGVASVTNDAPAQYPVGNTTVTWTVTDTAGLTATCTQTVTVTARGACCFWWGECQYVTEDECDTAEGTYAGDCVVCDPNPCDQPDPRIELVPVGDECLHAGDELVVEVWMFDIVEHIVGAQFFLSYDANRLILNTALDACVPGETPFTRQVYECSTDEQTNAQCPPGGVVGQLDYAVGVPDGDPSANHTKRLARLHFLADTDACDVSELVNFRSNPPFETRLTKSDGTPLVVPLAALASVRIDSTPPTITCPPNIAVGNDPNECAAVVTWNAATATDACGAAPTVVQTGGPAPGSTFAVNTPTTITYTATDECGNTASCSFTVSVSDLQDPTITCPADVAVNPDPGGCTASNVPLGTPTVWDNCGVDTYWNDAPAVFPLGTTVVTWTVRDVNGRTASCTQNVTVVGIGTFTAEVELQGPIAQATTRCVTFVFYNCQTSATTTVSGDIAFPASAGNSVGVGTFTNLACGNWQCVTAEDELHTLLAQSAPVIQGQQYLLDFTSPHMLYQDDLYDDNLCDIVDFGVYVAEWGWTGGPDTPCVGGPARHADMDASGFIDAQDFGFIASNFLLIGDEPCCAVPALPGQPRLTISVRELWQLGYGQLAVADLNHDGVVDVSDIQAFLNGVRPEKPEPLPSGASRPQRVRRAAN